MIFKQPISYRLVFIISFCPNRDHRKGVIKVLTASTVSYFSFGHGRMRARANDERRSREKRGTTDIFFACIGVLVLVFLLSSVLFHNHQILMASLAFFSLNTVSYYRQHWRWVK